LMRLLPGPHGVAAFGGELHCIVARIIDSFLDR
jgi:hypothetical protein